MELRDLRINYEKDSIEDGSFPRDPLAWFGDWIKQALASGSAEPNAMVLSTVSAEGRPSSRVVLLKQFNQEGFFFFSNYESKKAVHLASNPAAALLFHWPELERQVRIEGFIQKAGKTVSDGYFGSRPPESRVSAVVSPQSREIPDRRFLEKKYDDFMEANPDSVFSRPEYWGGYVLSPVLYEFWQGRSNRLHDRVQFEWLGEEWKRNRLAP